MFLYITRKYIPRVHTHFQMLLPARQEFHAFEGCQNMARGFKHFSLSFFTTSKS